MIFLVSMSGNSGFADARRAMRSFPQGVYDLTNDEEAVAWVRRAGSSQLVLVDADEPPVLTSPPIGEPLRALRGWTPTVSLPAGATVLAAHESVNFLRPYPPELPVVQGEESSSRPLDFPCGRCGRRFPSFQIRDLHTDVAHAADVQAELAAQPKPPPHEPALTSA